MDARWTFARVFKLMYERSNTGILDVLGPDGEVRLHLREGKVVNVETLDADRWMLGDFLLESETLAENQLYKVMRRAKKSQEPVEDVLVKRGLVTKDILKRFIELHVRETIFPLFRKTGITCRFDEVEPMANPWIAPIPAAYFLRNADRRTKLWPKLLQRIPNEDYVFDKVDTFIASILGQSGALPAQLTEEEGEEPKEMEPIGGNERIVYFYVNGKKTVRQLAYASCLGEFETYISLVKLHERGFIEAVTSKGKGEKLKKKRVVLPLAARTLAYVLAACVVAALIWLRPGALQHPEGFVSVMPPALEEHIQEHNRARVTTALETWFLTSERPWRYPIALEQLVSMELLGEGELEEPAWSEAFRYTAVGEPPLSYTLVKE